MNSFFLTFYFMACGAIIAVASILFSLYLFFKKRKRLIAEIAKESQGVMDEMLEREGLESEIGKIAEQKLEQLAEKIKSQMPMIAMFLSPELESHIKELAREEFLKALPDLKEKVLFKLKSKAPEFIEMGISKIDLKKQLTLLLLPILLFGAGVGFLAALPFFFMQS